MHSSWHDDGPLKFAALNEWAATFRREHAREPCIWLDKACIDQDDIDGSLACLPVFLAGCKTLLVLPGVTYCQRLWCCMELFTFVHIGGTIEGIEILPLVSGATPEERASKADAVCRSLLTFNAARASCFKLDDKHKLLAVVECGFGSLAAFNRVVQRLVEQYLPFTDDGTLRLSKIAERGFAGYAGSSESKSACALSGVQLSSVASCSASMLSANTCGVKSGLSRPCAPPKASAMATGHLRV